MLLYLAMLSSRSTYILSTSLKRNRQQQGYIIIIIIITYLSFARSMRLLEESVPTQGYRLTQRAKSPLLLLSLGHLAGLHR